MEFDIVAEREALGTKIEYGILCGGERAVFIKAGRGGTFRGEEDKYLRFAHYLREAHGATVICASNPEDVRNSLAQDLSVISEYAAWAEEEGIYLWGTSDGAFKCVDLAAELKFKRMVLVNMPLMVNFYRYKERIKAQDTGRIAFVFGDRDPSVKYIPFLYSLEGSAFRMLSGKGHVLSCTPEEQELYAELFFSDTYFGGR